MGRENLEPLTSASASDVLRYSSDATAVDLIMSISSQTFCVAAFITAAVANAITTLLLLLLLLLLLISDEFKILERKGRVGSPGAESL